MFFLKKYFLNLNLFESDSDNNEREDEQQRYWNIITTRVYLVVLVFILAVLAVYSWLSIETSIVTIEHPTIDQFELVPQDAQCPCSRTSVLYGDFISLEVIFHQVCSSDFVSGRWIKFINSGSKSSYFSIYDYRNHGSAQCQALASFCRLSKSTAEQSIAAFYQSTLLTPQVLSKSVLQLMTQSSINQFQLTAPNNFRLQLELVRKTTRDNEIISGLMTNRYFFYQIVQSGIEIVMTQLIYINVYRSTCACSNVLDCVIQSGFITSDTGLFTAIPGLSSGCLPVNAILSSTLECFYEQTCLDKLIGYFPTIEEFTAMSVDPQSRFSPNSTVKSIVDDLMIEEWKKNVSYDKYYIQCAPSSCSYLKTERHGLLFVLTKLISLLGGLTLVLGFVIPIIIQFIRRLLNPVSSPRVPRKYQEVQKYACSPLAVLHLLILSILVCVRLRQLKIRIQKLLIELNTFKHNPSSERQIRYQRHATRLYIFLIVISLVILTFYSLLIKQTSRSTVVHPTESEYIRLEEMYSLSLSCPCTFISVPYSSFISIEPEYHQLCSSDFVTLKWIIYITGHADIFYDLRDFRTVGVGQFQLLSLFCQQTQQIIDEALEIFLQTQFVGSQVLSETLFDVQGYSLIQEWQLATVNRFLRTIDLVRSTTQGNQLMNILNTHLETNLITRKTTVKFQTLWGCSYAQLRSCRIPLSFYNIPGRQLPYEVVNFFIDSYPIEALFASTLECFYNSSCLSEISTYVGGNSSMEFSVLDVNRSRSSETIEEIMHRMMVDSWSPNVSFSSYYKACSPSSCTFEYQHRYDIFFVITTITGIFGGLSVGFKLIILIGLQLIEKFIESLFRLDLIHFIKSVFTCNTEQQIVRRLHLVLVITTLYILYVFSVVTPQSITVEVNKPSLSMYQSLFTQYSDSLQCSCSKISIKYELFLSIVPNYHQICSSEFISERWITYLYDSDNFIHLYNPNNFRYSASGQFQLLASLCERSQRMVNDSLSELLADSFINAQISSLYSLDERVRTTIDRFQLKNADLFRNTLALIRETTQANMLISTYYTNWIFDTPANITDGLFLHTIPLVYEGCSCGLSSKCVVPSDGMMTGCYPLEALLQTKLRCLYEQQCIDSTDNFEALKLSKSSRFQLNSTIELILNELMVEQYSISMSYEDYFRECAPTSCIYSYVERINSVQGLTTLISLYGGVVTICRVVAIIIVNLFKCQRRAIHPQINFQ